jgi:hypothetical protein
VWSLRRRLNVERGVCAANVRLGSLETSQVEFSADQTSHHFIRAHLYRLGCRDSRPPHLLLAMDENASLKRPLALAAFDPQRGG